MSKSLKLVIFDCDGTLVDSQDMIVAAMHHTYRAHGLPMPSRESLLGIVGLSLPDAFAVLGDGRAGFPVAALVARYRTEFHALREGGKYLEPLYPGARDCLDALSARPDVLLSVATGKSRRGVAEVLGRHDLLDRFHTIQTADDAPSKPHPGMVIAAMRATAVEAADTVVVGDTAFDIEMARAAGAAAIGVSWGYHRPAALHGAGAHAVIEDFSALLPALERMWTR